MMSSRRVAIVLLLLALVAAMAISVVRGDECAQEHASNAAAVAIRRELRRRVYPGGGNRNAAGPSALLGSGSLALVVGISSLVAGALLQKV